MNNDEIRIVTLIENHPDIEGKLLCEHGLSFYIEADGMKILFDTGQTGAFIENAKRLAVDLSDLDYMVISHGHYDHSGGLKAFMDMGWRLPTLLVGKGFFKSKYRKSEHDTCKYIGNSFSKDELAAHKCKCIEIKTMDYAISDHLVFYRKFNHWTSYEKLNDKFFLMDQDRRVTDDFDDEIVLSIETANGMLLIVGCAHAGIVNIMKTIKARSHEPIYGMVGGTHLVDADAKRIDETMAYFHEEGLELIGAAHCTGDIAIEEFKKQFGNRFASVCSGKKISCQVI